MRLTLLKNFGLPKACLLRKSREFEQVYKKGKRLHGDGFTLIYCRNNLDSSRVGISIHRQIKGAVKRNRLKRIIRESFRLNRELYPSKADIIMAIKPENTFTSPESVSQAVSHLNDVGNFADDDSK